ncbi:MAG TPA: ABC transporter permease subunit [candidate division Zixibacteria bacterium]|nr:ABC transporter permease subunit [candidate division Zixibacteria bacterium]
MIHRVIILEENRYTADQIVRTLRETGIDAATVVATIDEAYQSLGRRSYDLALIPSKYLGRHIRTLSAIEPKLRFILTVSSTGDKASLHYEDPVIGHVPIDQVESVLPVMLSTIDQDLSALPTPGSTNSQALTQTGLKAPVLMASATTEPLEPGSPTGSIGRELRRRPNPEKKSAADGSRWQGFINLVVFLVPRLFFGALVLLFIIWLSYLGLNMAGGMSVGEAALDAFPDTLAYVVRLLHGSLGETGVASGSLISVPVGEVVAVILPRSLGLVGLSVLLATIVGLFLGIRAASRGSKRSLGILVATIIGISIPSFFAAFLLQWLVITLTRQTGRPLIPAGGFGWDTHLILPVLVLAARPLAQITRISFISISEVREQDYIRTARSKGLRNYQITLRHVMRNAAIPILSTIGISVRFALTILPIVESFFGWPGAGAALLKGIAQQDSDLVVALLLCFGLLFILINIILEFSYRLIDPRLWNRPASAGSKSRNRPIDLIRGAAEYGQDILKNNPLTDLYRQIRASRKTDPSPLSQQLVPQLKQDDPDIALPTARKIGWQAAVRNLPFMLGGILVLGLVAVIFFGPNMAPNSPYHTLGLVEIDGQLTPPPFPPDATYPMGTDALGRGILSLLLAGAQQTLVLGLLVVGARILAGVLLGAIAGWTNGSWMDRLIVGTSEALAAFPALLLAMIFILALGIRQGLPPFVIALCLVGWGEVMIFVRGEVIRIRPQPHIESAIALGARTPRIVGRHILPLILASLISIAAIEMGAVLMLLGELGFISIFIGGGSLINLPSYTMLYSDVPEWGALLANVRLLARGYPWTAFYPMLAFFIAIMAFNLFGEGLRRLVADGSLIINRIFNRYTFLFVVIVMVAIYWFQSNSGATPFYRAHAKEFAAQEAMVYLEDLITPEMEGRALGSAGMDEAAEYIALKFDDLGLQAGGQKDTFFQERRHSYMQLESDPLLAIHDGGPEPVLGEDYAAYPGRAMNDGAISGPIRFVGLGQMSPFFSSTWRPTYPELERMDFSEDIILVLSDREVDILHWKGKGGMLIMTDDPDKLSRRYTIGGLAPWGDTPWIWVTEDTVNRLLAGSGYAVEDLQEQIEHLPPENVLTMPISTEVSMAVDGTYVKNYPVRNVIGYIPGTSGMDRCTVCLGENLIVVMVQYDRPPIGPDGQVYQGASDNAGSTAVMLEAIRVIQETDYQPYKSFLFVAYSGEGLDGGELVNDPDVKRFLQARTGMSKFKVEAIIRLHGLGGDSGDRLIVSSGGSLRLAELMDEAAGHMGVKSKRSDDAIQMAFVYEDNPFAQGGQEAPTVILAWEGWQDTSGLPLDDADHISTDNLEDAGRSLAMALMILGREINY